MTKILIAPGLGSSGPVHWQTLWENEHPEYSRIEQKDWNTPVCKDWMQKIEEDVERSGPDTVIVAHSLACLALAFWSAKTKKTLKGALLVAPPDSEREDFPKEASGFAPIPQIKLGFPSLVIASTNDEYISIERCKFLADTWGSRFINVGAKGHINSASNLGNWKEGKILLSRFLEVVQKDR